MVKTLADLPKRCAMYVQEILVLVEDDCLLIYNIDQLNSDTPTPYFRTSQTELRVGFKFIPLEFFE